MGVYDLFLSYWILSLFYKCKKKLVSIIINCYNGEKYLHKTLDSVKSQNHKNFELIFIDNSSTDNNVKKFSNHLKINDLNILKQKKKLKLYKARNLALKRCNGEFITLGCR